MQALACAAFAEGQVVNRSWDFWVCLARHQEQVRRDRSAARYLAGEHWVGRYRPAKLGAAYEDVLPVSSARVGRAALSLRSLGSARLSECVLPGALDEHATAGFLLLPAWITLVLVTPGVF